MNNKIFKSIFLGTVLLSVLGVSAGLAQSSTPESVVKELYKMHDQDLKGNNNRILSGQIRKMLDKFFDKKLADFIWKDLTSNSDEVGVLDFDPFYNAQDFDVKNFSAAKAKIVGTKATVVVKFNNFDRRDTLNYQLVRRNSVWKISDIKYTDGTSLLGYFKEAAKNPSN
jgi:ABC-type transporter MlaC component